MHVRRQDNLAGRLEIERERRARERVKEKRKDDSRVVWQREIAPLMRSWKLSEMSDYYAKPDMRSQAMATERAESLLRGTEPDQTKSN